MIPVDDATSLSRLFHLNSEPWLNETAYRGAPFQQAFKEYPDASRTSLPPARESTVASLAGGRRSVRDFAVETLPVQTVADLLHTAYGVVEVAPLESGGAYLRRSVPSAGGLYPLELYLLLRRVEGIEDGIYHYDARAHELALLRAGDWKDDAESVFYAWPFVTEANVIVCQAAMFQRIQKKYGPRGYRYALLEAGHVAQNLCLAATALQLGTLCMGGWRDGALNRLLGLSAPEEGVVYAVAFGPKA